MASVKNINLRNMKLLKQCISFSRNKFEKPQLGPPLDLSVYGLRYSEMRANDKISCDKPLKAMWTLLLK